MVLKQKGAMPSFSRHESTKIIRKMVFLFALIAGRATSFVLKQKEAKIQDDNDPSARRASTWLGVLVGPALLFGLSTARGN